MTTLWHTQPADEVLGRLAVDPQSGLSRDEADKRAAQYGPNTLTTEYAEKWYHVLVRQFTDILILILLIAAGISLAIGHITDAITILAIVVINGILGFVQEWRAEKALEALQQLLAPKCTVVRDGRSQSRAAQDLVPGDIVHLATGDSIPADVRLIRATHLTTDESALTGEPEAIHKDTHAVAADAPLARRTGMGWMGTTVTNGWAHGVVVATGMQTEFGRIAGLTQSVEREMTPLQKRLGALGKQLGVISLSLASAVGLIGWLTGKSAVDMFLTGVSLAVAVVPEGLPAVVTLTLGLGVRQMVKRRALLRRLQAAETLGSATVICTDKTGTLTQNEMTVRKIWLRSGTLDATGTGYDPEGHFEIDGVRTEYDSRSDLLALLDAGAFCNHAVVRKAGARWEKIGEPTEAALVVAAYKAWRDVPAEREILAEFPFTSTRKRMTAVQRSDEGRAAVMKGAPEVILERCTHILDGDAVRALTAADRDDASRAYADMASTGLRTLAVARRRLPEHIDLDEDAVEHEFTLLGVVGIIDPPRPEVPDAVRLAHTAGIRVVMITGDAPDTAAAIARSIGIRGDRALIGAELASMDDAELTDILAREEVLFARTTPEQKLRIVNLLQDAGHVVGMTGDGVNDAPALRAADIGIAMGVRGTDVARGASDLILTDDNFASIISAVEEGRRQYENIQKFVGYLMASNTGEVVAIFVNILIGGPLILVPVQILWINLITDGLSAVALGVEPPGHDTMRHPPRSATEPILTRQSILLILVVGAYIGGGTLWLYHHYLVDASPHTYAVAQTVAFTGIILLEKAIVFNFRSLREPLYRIGFFSNPWVVAATCGTIGVQAAAVYTPVLQKMLHTTALDLRAWGVILAWALPGFFAVEIYKGVRERLAREAPAPAG